MSAGAQRVASPPPRDHNAGMLPTLLPTLLATALLAPVDEPVTLTPETVAEHDRLVVQVMLGPKGKTLVTLTDEGALHSIDLKDGSRRWTTMPDMVLPEGGGVGGDEAWYVAACGAKIAARALSRVAAYTTIDLEDGTEASGTGGTTFQQRTGAILVDPKDRWIWIGTQTGTMTRLLVNDLKGWSNRGMDNSGVTALAMDGKGKEIAVGGKDGSLRFIGNTSCDVDDKAVFEGHQTQVSAVAWHPKKGEVATGDLNGQVLIRTRRGGKTKRALAVLGASVRCLAFHPKGDWIAIGDSEGRLTLWDPDKGDQLAEATVEGKLKGVHDILVLDKGKRIVAACGGKELVSFDVSEVGK